MGCAMVHRVYYLPSNLWPRTCSAPLDTNIYICMQTHHFVDTLLNIMKCFSLSGRDACIHLMKPVKIECRGAAVCVMAACTDYAIPAQQNVAKSVFILIRWPLLATELSSACGTPKFPQTYKRVLLKKPFLRNGRG